MLREMKAKGLILADLDVEAVKATLEKKYEIEGGQKARIESAGLQPYNERLESVPIKYYEGCVKFDVNDDGVREDCVFACLPDLDIYLSGKPLHVVSRAGTSPEVS